MRALAVSWSRRTRLRFWARQVAGVLDQAVTDAPPAIAFGRGYRAVLGSTADAIRHRGRNAADDLARDTTHRIVRREFASWLASAHCSETRALDIPLLLSHFTPQLPHAPVSQRLTRRSLPFGPVA